jgi:polysaccharide pyruvyl transferase WcaK-like protein
LNHESASVSAGKASVARTLTPLINAWVGRGNYGDELLSYGLRLDLCKAAAVSRVGYYQPGGDRIFRAGNEKVAIDRVSARRIPLLGRLFPRHGDLSRYDSLLFGGGSVLHSVRGIERKLDLLRAFRRGRAKSGSLAGCFGVSLGPFDTVATERLLARFLSELDFVVCRDRTSVDIVRGLVPVARVWNGCDLAFAAWEQNRELFMRECRETRVGISLILDRRKDATEQARLFANMLAILDWLTAAGCGVRLVALYVGAKYEDHLLHERLRGQARHPEMIEIHHYAGDVFSTVAAIAGCSHYVSMRLHGAITAYLSGVPFLTLSKSPKVADFSAEAHKGSHVPALLDIGGGREDLFAGLDRLLSLTRWQSGSESHLVATYERGRDSIRQALQ